MPSAAVRTDRGGRATRLGASVAVAVGLVLGVAACSTASIPMPPDEATPEQVVRAYADAVRAGDCRTADALVLRGGSWCGDIEMTALTVTDQAQEKRETEAGNGPLIQRVWVEVTIEGGDGSLPDGRNLWSYLLDRTGPSGAWRIYDQGMG